MRPFQHFTDAELAQHIAMNDAMADRYRARTLHGSENSELAFHEIQADGARREASLRAEILPIAAE